MPSINTARTDYLLGEAIVTQAFVPGTPDDYESVDLAIWVGDQRKSLVLLEGLSVYDVLFEARPSDQAPDTGYTFEHVVEYGFNDEFMPVGGSTVRIEYVIHRANQRRPIVLVHLATLHNVRAVPELSRMTDE